MKMVYCFIICLFGVATMAAQAIPKELWGKWIVRRELPTTTISCWGEPEAKKIIGTELEYSDKHFRWNGITTKDPTAEMRIITAKQFQDENSGGSVNSSQVTFQQLGIKQESAVEITIQHKDAHVSAATNEIPGDEVLVKDANTIVFSVCSLYFEANRVRGRK